MEEGESCKQALQRELREELEEITLRLGLRLPSPPIPKPKKTFYLGRGCGGSKGTNVTMGCIIDCADTFALIRNALAIETQDYHHPLCLLQEEEFDQVNTVDTSNPEHREYGFDKETLAMFPDEFAAMQRFFKASKNG